MKLRILAFAVFFALAGCFTGNSPIGGAPGLNPGAAPIGGGGMAGPGAFGTSGSSAGGDAGAQGAADDGGTGFDKGGGAPDPTAVDDAPITMTGTPLGVSRKPEPCPQDFRLCFYNLTITATPGDGTGRLHYGVDGTLAAQAPGGEIAGAPHVFVYLIDLLFPNNQKTTATDKPSGEFVATADASPGHGLRFQAEFCRHTTTLDTTLPESAASPLVLNPCGGTDPTDVVGPPTRSPLPFHDLPFGQDTEVRSLKMSE